MMAQESFAPGVLRDSVQRHVSNRFLSERA